MSLTTTKNDIIHAVAGQADPQSDPQKAELLSAFIKRYYSTTSLSDLRERSPQEWYLLAQAHFNFSYVRKPGEIKVRALNPKHSTHTVIEVTTKDMPFLVDSTRMEINRRNLMVHFIVHMGGLLVIRNDKHQIEHVLSAGAYDERAHSEAVIHIEIDRQTDEVILKDMEESIHRVLEDVAAAVEDWLPMRERLHEVLLDLEQAHLPLDPTEIAESKDFLRWLDSEHFTFLGSRDYTLVGEGKNRAFQIIKDSGLGVLRDSTKSKVSRQFSEMPEEARKQILSSQILIIAKTNTVSTVHRPVYTDYIGVKRFNAQGELIGERRFIGLYTSAAYGSHPKHIPFLRHKVARIMQMSALPPNGHAGKALLTILETLPRDDLFQATPEELLELSMGILHLQERPRIRLFMRRDSYGRFFSCLVYLPRDHFNTEMRQKIQAILDRELGSQHTSFTTLFSEDSILMRVHFLIRVDAKKPITVRVEEIENLLIEAGRSWEDRLRDCLIQKAGEAQGVFYFNKYKDAFPEGYKEYYPADIAVTDIQYLENITPEKPFNITFYRSTFKETDVLRFKLYHLIHTIPLSDILPVLENMGLRIQGERSHELLIQGQSVWINDLDLIYVEGATLDLEAVREKFQDTFLAIWDGRAESDGFNRLVLKAGLTCREVMLLRVYARYLQQIQFTFSQSYLETILVKHTEITQQLIEYFHERFHPEHHKANCDRFIHKIQKQLNTVTVLDEDRILRRYLELIAATVRTNFYQKDEAGQWKDYISVKLLPEKISDLPLPKPLFETFIYSVAVEGVHLRMSKVARGGLRWSDRPEDFRVEVLGLMKAQQVKNAVIVPSGAKGGFYPKHLPTQDRDAIAAEGKRCYQIFIRGLLDLVDNLKEGEVIHPRDVVYHDNDDTYLVVAADKGTATFSDTANQISKAYGYWLGDAFASGGSVGYDHKKMGITARGAWESVKRNFRERLNMNTQAQDFTVVGIGDMSGDVFGNGMLCSPHIKLIAAFNHMHIFIDPKPDTEVSYQERKRLFDLPRSTWADYNLALISKGGGIFNRSEKSIKLSPEIKKCLGVKKERIEPSDLIHAILCAPVDLLWNGGIGTYVKAAHESHQSVGDRVNDILRVNGKELRCKIVAEGGNLGFTQQGRVEYALNGGVLYTDFVDNSAGVNCSDHEVNIKILLDDIVRRGRLSGEARDQLLAQMTDEVASLVLRSNYAQASAISFAFKRAPQSIDTYRRLIQAMESRGKIDRELEFLPSNEALIDRKVKGIGLMKPELAILYSYSKNILKQELIESSIPDEATFTPILQAAFPRALQEKFATDLNAHPLRREIIATQLANQFINRMGINFMERTRRQTGASIADIVRAYHVCTQIFFAEHLWLQIEALDYTVSDQIQFELAQNVYALMRRAVRWFLKSYPKGIEVDVIRKKYEKSIQVLHPTLANHLVGIDQERYEDLVHRYVARSVPETLARQIALCSVSMYSLDIVSAAEDNHASLESMASIYFTLNVDLELDWLRNKLIAQPIDNQWEESARYGFLDEMDIQQRHLSINVLKALPKDTPLDEAFSAWRACYAEVIHRWNTLLAELKLSDSLNYTMYSVAIRSLIDMVQITS